MDITFAQMICKILDAKGWTEARLAQETGVSQSTVHRIKAGKIKNPGYRAGAHLRQLYDAVVAETA